VDRIVAAHWRLGRLGRVKAGVFAYELYGELAERARREASTHEKAVLDDMAGIYDATVVMDEQKHQEALSRAQEAEALQEDEGTATLGRTFIRDAGGANAFSKLSRYEAAIERSLYRALHELQRLQAARYVQGGVAPPVAVDVNVSGLPGEGP
jgi:hypothetical protein